jgi:hypothetical protein
MDISELIGEVSEKGKITKLEVVGIKEAFKDTSRIPPDRLDKMKGRDFLRITVKYSGGEFTEAHQIPKGLKYQNGKWQKVDKLSLARSLHNQASWFRAFIKNYKDLPSEDMEIDITLNERGFARIKI